MRFLAPDVTEAARQHAMAVFPQESCGGVTEDGYLAFENRSPEPEAHFDCAAAIEPLIAAGALLALIHSHPQPNASPSPSHHDIAQQIVMDLPWGIVIAAHDAALAPYFWSDQIEPPPLEGRDFRYGPSGTDGRGDCAALVRDWYRLERGVLLPEFARDHRSWKQGADIYRRNMSASGFVRVLTPKSVEPAIGDVALLTVRAEEPNHAALYIGGGLILHHLENRLSRREPLLRWRDHITDWYRR